MPLCYIMHLAPKATSYASLYAYKTPEKTFFRIGDQLITLEKYGNGSSRQYAIVALHGNETSAIEGAQAFAQAHGANFFRIGNQETQKVEGVLMDRKICFDPNNIFTVNGRKA